MRHVAHVCSFEKNGRPMIAWDNAKDIKLGDKLYVATKEPLEYWSVVKNFECPRCGHCCKTDLARVGEVGVWGEWQGLTDEEVSEVIDNVLEGGGWLDVARALEAAIKEKNT